jgi:hypothetical protein
VLELRAVDEGAVPASAPATSRFFVLPVATRLWVLTDNNYFKRKISIFPSKVMYRRDGKKDTREDKRS